MITIYGNRNQAVVYTTANEETAIDQSTRGQIQSMCDLEPLEGSNIRIMPDVHAGKLCPVGFTATVGNKIMPALTGGDIGCGVTMVRIRKGLADWNRLDSVIRENVPSGGAIRRKASTFAASSGWDPSELVCQRSIRASGHDLALGTLGGGNHFIEVDGYEDEMYLTVHSGSRSLGQAVHDAYMRTGMNHLKSHGIKAPYENTWLEGSLLESYLRDLAVVERYASANRMIIIREILKGMKWKADDPVSSVHNCVSSDEATIREAGAAVIRKGAVSALKDQPVLIPISMSQGVIVASGKGAKEWNCSSPHGAGRILKRSQAKKTLGMEEYRRSMEGIYSSCIREDTLDESPMAYRM